MARSGISPAQKRREVLSQAIRARGESPYNIWLVRLPFDGDALCLTSDPAVELFYALEGDPRLAQIDYTPLRNTVLRPSSRHLEFARVVTTDGATERVFLTRPVDTPVTSPEPGCVYYSLEDLDPLCIRIANWRHIVACIRRVRLHATAVLERRLWRRVPVEGTVSLQTLRDEADEPAGLVYGAIGALLRRRELTSDCDIYPWSLHTQLGRVS